ncbi:MAG TPA: winged helix-turn-helix domain-containing protein [Candidatus Megaira endosymbiont of Hartmannula sinica]|nr:winged helix-turn-helix domain-containing protein [Candidatus Megaera endosymbiont of Hartmannula sinica]
MQIIRNKSFDNQNHSISNKTNDILPIIFLIDESENASNYYNGLGTNVYVLRRPFFYDQLLRMTKMVVRKNRASFNLRVLEYNSDIKLDLLTKKLLINDKEIVLGPTEFRILKLMIQNPRKIYSREKIIEYIWGDSKNVVTRTIDVHINRIRSIIFKHTNSKLSPIKTVRSHGYSMS